VTYCSSDARACESRTGTRDTRRHVRGDHQVRRALTGERQRVAIVRALVTSPRIVLADETTSGLGAEETDKVLALLPASRDARRSDARRACGAVGVTRVRTGPGRLAPTQPLSEPMARST